MATVLQIHLSVFLIQCIQWRTHSICLLSLSFSVASLFVSRCVFVSKKFGWFCCCVCVCVLFWVAKLLLFLFYMILINFTMCHSSDVVAAVRCWRDPFGGQVTKQITKFSAFIAVYRNLILWVCMCVEMTKLPKTGQLRPHSTTNRIYIHKFHPLLSLTHIFIQST